MIVHVRLTDVITGLFGWRQSDEFKKADRGGIKVAHRLGLQTIGEHRKQKLPADVGWRVLSEACAPSGLQRLDAETAQARDLGFHGGALERLRSNPGSRHGGQD
jgi:hypothetical protein